MIMHFFQGPQPYEVEAGDTATFRCNAVADTDLDLAINWLKDGRRIDFDSEPRFIQTNDNSLTITKTTELDSGREIVRISQKFWKGKKNGIQYLSPC